MSEDSVIVPMPKDSKRVWIPLTPSEHMAFFKIARRLNTSMNELGRYAVVDFVKPQKVME